MNSGHHHDHRQSQEGRHHRGLLRNPLLEPAVAPVTPVAPVVPEPDPLLRELVTNELARDRRSTVWTVDNVLPLSSFHVVVIGMAERSEAVKVSVKLEKSLDVRDPTA